MVFYLSTSLCLLVLLTTLKEGSLFWFRKIFQEPTNWFSRCYMLTYRHWELKRYFSQIFGATAPKFEFLTAMLLKVPVFWNIKSLGCYTAPSSEESCSQNFNTYLAIYTASYPRRPFSSSHCTLINIPINWIVIQYLQRQELLLVQWAIKWQFSSALILRKI